jgi:murein DD-endopeptidase MepM/ murein hydrolase activator NlpD
MPERALGFAVAVLLVVCASYYAGYWQGSHSLPAAHSERPAESAAEAERVREPTPRSLPAQTDASGDDYRSLLARNLTMPVAGVKPSSVLDTFVESRGSGRRHEATDIMAPRGTPVHALADGEIQKLFVSKAGGNSIYEFDPQAIYCFYYAHLDHYADGLREGTKVKTGDVIGYVGSTGNASPTAPHLHFAILRLSPDKKWWEGVAINPYPILMRLVK